MRAGRNEQGVALLTLILLLFVVVVLVNVAANHWYRAFDREQYALNQDRALHIARGGVRLAAARLEDEAGFSGVLEGPDVRVVVDGDTIRSTCTLHPREVRVRWRRKGEEIELFDWEH